MKIKKIALFLVLFLLLTVALSVAVSAEDMYDPNSADPDDIVLRIVIGYVIGLVLALVIVLVMVRKMSTVRPVKTADGYVKKNSFRLTESRDIYLYSRITRVRVNTNNNKR